MVLRGPGSYSEFQQGESVFPGNPTAAKEPSGCRLESLEN